MKSPNILLGPALLIVVVCFLSLSATKSTPDCESECIPTIQQKTVAIVDPMELYIYETRKEKLERAVLEYFKKAIKSGEVVGAGISIVKGDSIILSKGFGKRDINYDSEVNGETIFRLGSLSKGFAGVLAGSLKNDGLLNYDDKVTDYIPCFKLGNDENTSKITLANILSHTSGTPYHSFTNLVEAGLSMRAIAARFKDVKPISEPGALYSYQNAMFALSDEVFHAATGKLIGEEFQEKFFTPLHMLTASTDFESISKSTNFAVPHNKSRNSYKSIKLTDKYYNAVAAGGVNASAEDMAKWMRFLLGHNSEVLGQKSLDEVFKPEIEVKGHGKYYQRWKGHISSYYGFGWRIHKFKDDSEDKEKTIIHHGGSVNQYRNEVAMYPEEDLGICVLFNSNTQLAKTVIPELHNIVKEIYDSPIEKQTLSQVSQK
ncbi:beta-lactamase class C [Flavobacteriaceae bacterium MAR_2010_188]|nr:beta-lactamase class C [Flavobacteriaceae bacterium MAR_2010_188]